MKKQVIAGLLCLAATVHLNAQFEISGRVIDEKKLPVEGASIIISELNRGTISGPEGFFKIPSVPKGTYQLVVSYLGFETAEQRIEVDRQVDVGEIRLKQLFFRGEEVTISALKAGKKTPMAYTNLNDQEILAMNTGRDIPYVMQTTPSLITSSDAGNGVGYTSMRIRGSDANRINVTINGIPLNDAESHGVFWVDLPELASSTEQIQIQRGVGTSTNGAAAFGATVNMQTDLINKQPYTNYYGTAGSFNTIRNTISAGSGLLYDKFTFDVRLSDLRSDGYIDRAWTDLQSYYFSAGWYEELSSLKFITFGGFEELYQAWGGVPSDLLDTRRTFNAMGAYTDSAGETAYYGNQIDHYDQIHYQLHYNRQISSRIYLNTALHYTKGSGYYEEYETDQEYDYYGMQKPVTGNDTLFSTDLVRRKWLDNDFYGAIASLSYENENNNLILGGGWNRYLGKHFGKVIWARYFGENIPGHQWYDGTGDKYDWNVYGKYYYFFSQKLTGFIDLQLRSIQHDIDGQDANNRDVTQAHNYLFFNPKAGVNFEPFPDHRTFLSYARANREPNRNNYTDAPPEREPVPERLDDYEAGYSYSGNNFSTGVTAYLMRYYNQLVLTGQINEVGYPVMTNVEDSYRAGIELEMGFSLYDKFIWKGNITFSRNEILDFVNYIDNWDYWSDPANEPYQVQQEVGRSSLAYSPSVVAASQLDYKIEGGFRFALISKYVGKQYIDNTSNENYIIDPYFVNDLSASYSMHPGWAEEISLSILIANLFDIEYETNAWLYRYYSGGREYYMDGYYPQAGRNLLVSLKARF
ncbi:MAG: TonB-dependent receptor [Bacteroidales bacterium]|nr:TonB-dependent receptor [Bacteroidales bacterium]